METDELQEYLNALGRSDNYRVDAVLSDAPHERTERVVQKATELAPEKRFQSVEALKAAFLGALASARPAEQPPSIAPKPTAQRKPNRQKRFFSRIPLGVGVAWDVILLLAWLLFFAASNAVIVSPTGEVAQHPLWFRSSSTTASSFCPLPYLCTTCSICALFGSSSQKRNSSHVAKHGLSRSLPFSCSSSQRSLSAPSQASSVLDR